MGGEFRNHLKVEKQLAALPLALRNLLAMASGVVTIITLNVLTPTEFFRDRFSILLAEGPGFMAAAFAGGALFLTLASLAISHLTMRPVSTWLEAGGAESNNPQLLQAARLRSLSLPGMVALWDLLVWLFSAGIMVAVSFTAFGVTPGFVAFFVFRGLLVGLMSSCLALLLVEDICRKTIIPMLFPKGGLVGLEGGWRIPLLFRIRVLLLLGTHIPLLILTGTIGLATMDLLPGEKSAVQFGWELFLFAAVLSLLFFLLAARLNRKMGDSITEPLRAIQKAMHKVGEGDFSSYIPAVSNDELGEVSEAANHMIGGLAEKEWIREVFGKYVTPEVRDVILKGKVSLEGESREATVLFADLRGFTPFVENNRPEEVLSAMRSYFTAMHTEIRRYGGVVLQFVGDEIEAVFGVPAPLENHAALAVKAALGMRQALKELNLRREWDGRPPFAHGVGIHTGTVLAGNTGSYDQLSYGLIGGTVNVASRIQDLTKKMKHDILVSRDTWQMAGDGRSYQEMPPTEIKGISRPIVVYKVLE